MVVTAVAQLLHELTPSVLGTVVRRFRDFAAAEDAVQEASLAAAMQWPRDGVPSNPAAWLTQVALRRMTDHIRSESARRRREGEAAQDTVSSFASMELPPQEDDVLTLLFLCCHPSLSPSSAIALTLRAVGGLTTAQIAHAFLVPEATMAQRIGRAKQTIRNSGVPFDGQHRLREVLHVLYLMFNEGYTSSSGAGSQCVDLALEAMRLTRIVHRLQPGDPEAAGLLALMLLTDARRLARTNGEGEMIPLDRQDRSLWSQQQIAEGGAILAATLPKGELGPYQLQAAIAAVHDEAPSAAQTDWPQILALYGLLRRMSSGNPMVELNHAIAVAMVQGAANGLRLIDELKADPRIAEHHRLEAVRAHLLELSGDAEGAACCYRAAAGKTASLPERSYLLAQSARLLRL